MNFRSSKTSDPQRLSLNLLDKIKLKRRGKYLVLSNISVLSTINKKV